MNQTRCKRSLFFSKPKLLHTSCKHPIIESFEPNEDWRWCYIDQTYVEQRIHGINPLPGAKTVKAFNSIYFKVLEEKAFRSGDDRIAVQVCGDDRQAKETVKKLIEDIGFAPQDLGDLSQGVLFEPDAPLYNQNLKISEAEELLSQSK